MKKKKNIQGTFDVLAVNNGQMTKFTPSNKEEGEIHFRIESLTGEDGSGLKYLINFDGESKDGYVDLSTMKGYLIL